MRQIRTSGLQVRFVTRGLQLFCLETHAVALLCPDCRKCQNDLGEPSIDDEILNDAVSVRLEPLEQGRI